MKPKDGRMFHAASAKVHQQKLHTSYYWSTTF